MKVYKFEEILNDLMDYFILGDPEYLFQYKELKKLPDDLLTEFTTNDTADEAVEQGVIVPMIGVENYPYRIYFNLSNEIPVLSKQGNQLQHKKDGYCLRIKNGELYLYTMPYLKNFVKETLNSLKSNELLFPSQFLAGRCENPRIKIENGWYSVSILAGLSKETNDKNENFEPTYEFLIKKADDKPNYNGDFLYKFIIEN